MYRLPQLLLMALLTLLLGVGAGRLRAQNAAPPRPPGFTYGDLKEVTVQGQLVSLTEWLGKAYGANSRGVEGRHYALRQIDGTLYTFFPNRQYHALVEADRLKDRPVEIRARHFPRSHLLEILSYRALPEDALKAEYFCDTCTITSYQPGPCVCCGMEVKLVKPGP